MKKAGTRKKKSAKSKAATRKKTSKSPSKISTSEKRLERLVRERTRALLESEEKYRLAVESSPNLVFIVQEGQVVYANPALVRMSGMPEEKLLVSAEDLIKQYIAPEYRNLIRKNLRRRLAGEDVGEYEIEVVDRDGERRNMIVKSQLITYRGKPAEMGLFVDITEHRRMEERLRLLYQAIDQALDGIAVADMDGYVLFSNRAWAKMHGMEIKNIVGKHLSIFHSPEQLEREVNPSNRIAQERGAIQAEIGHRRADGTEFRTWMSITLLRNDKGEPVGMIGVARDIAERKQMEDQAIRSERLAMAGLIASGIAHEVNNPLTAIYASAQILARELKEAPESVRDRVDKILTGSERIRELMKNFLDFARPARDENKIKLDVNQVLMESLMMTSHLKKKSTEIKTRLEPDMPQVLADPNQLSTVFTNLLINAHQALETGGDCIEVETRSKDNKWVEVMVRDNGIGIPPESGNRIFEPFFTTKSSEEGTGLGLAIVYSILANLGGNVRFQSKPGVMTEFFVNLPIAR
jgi:PAS domain S-box-containing protein